MLKEICEHILSHSGITWVLGEDFFAGHLPIKNKNDVIVPDRCMAILENTPAALVPDLPDRADKAIQVWNRAATYFTARGDAQEIFDILHGAVQWDLPASSGEPEYTAMVIKAVGTPAPVENPDSKGRYVFSTNYIFMIMEKNA